MSRVDRAAMRGLRRFGGYTRQVARRSIRKGGTKQSPAQFDPALKRQVNDILAKGYQLSDIDLQPWPVRTSKRGRPPKYRVRGPYSLRDGIFFVADLKSRSVVIGPRIGSRQDIPAKIEFGSTENDGGEWVTIWEDGRPKIRLAKGRGKRVKVEPRPFMGPAYDAALDDLVPEIWRNSI